MAKREYGLGLYSLTQGHASWKTLFFERLEIKSVISAYEVFACFLDIISETLKQRF
jgi:hypothetical protein